MGTTKSAISRLESSLRTDKHPPMLFNAYEFLFLFLPLTLAGYFWVARRAGDVVLISKDSDFIELIEQRGTPPRMLWVTCGNLTNRRLREVFGSLFIDAIALLEAGEQIVELGDA